MYDLFGSSYSREYAASRSLPLFAEIGRLREDKDGWGVDFYFLTGVLMLRSVLRRLG